MPADRAGRRNAMIWVRVSAAEQRVLQDAARRAGVTVSALIRECVAERWLTDRVSERADAGGQQ